MFAFEAKYGFTFQITANRYTQQTEPEPKHDTDCRHKSEGVSVLRAVCLEETRQLDGAASLKANRTVYEYITPCDVSAEAKVKC